MFIFFSIILSRWKLSTNIEISSLSTSSSLLFTLSTYSKISYNQIIKSSKVFFFCNIWHFCIIFCFFTKSSYWLGILLSTRIRVAVVAEPLRSSILLSTCSIYLSKTFFLLYALIFQNTLYQLQRIIFLNQHEQNPTNQRQI